MKKPLLCKVLQRYFSIASMLLALGSNIQATCVLTNPTHTNYTEYLTLARSHNNQNNWPQALEAYFAATLSNPLEADPFIELAEYYAKTNEPQLCYLFARRAAELSLANNDFINHLLSYSAWHVGDYECGLMATKARLLNNHNNNSLLSTLTLYIQKKQACLKKEKPHKILQTMPAFHAMGGLEMHVLMFNKFFAQHQLSAHILTIGELVTRLTHQEGSPFGLPSVSYPHSTYSAYADDIIEQSPDIVVCNWIDEVAIAALKAKHFIPIKIIYVHHNSPDDSKLLRHIDTLSQCDGIVLIDSRMGKELEAIFKKNHLKMPIAESIVPFFDAEKFLSFVPSRTKKDFFAQEFAINLTDDYPSITMIANMIENKNQLLLFKALDILYNQRDKKFHTYLAGHGPDLEKNKNIINSMNLNDYVHFLGQTLKTPELLHYSDVHVLTSKLESFGIVHAEAALMKKPFVGADSTAISSYIQPGINGFTFENNNAEDLANKLELLLDKPELCKTMGENAYRYTLEHFVPDVTFTKWQNFLSKIY